MDPHQKKGLKISNEGSSVPKPEPSRKTELEQKADAVFQKGQQYREKIADLTSKFQGVIADQTLPENKTSIHRTLEQEIMSNLTSLAVEMNQDEYQSDGIGSTYINMILMKTLVSQRDTINLLNYRISKIEKLLNDVKK